ncbi:MAG: carbohydrate-binding domain-containing protein, partial [Coriobacteriia bacterium]|nr:carbohydrate-binding domain-containing protein [Coriobacteriia bacterium]
MHAEKKASIRHILAVLLTAVMIIGLVPAALFQVKLSFAAPVAANPGDIRDVNTIGAGNNWNITQGGTYTLRGATNFNSWVTVNTASPVTIVLDSASITNALQSPIQLGANANVTLDVRGINTLACVGTTNTLLAGIYVPSTATLTIVGDGTLRTLGNSVNAGNGNPPDVYGGAGIGGSTSGSINAGTINISSDDVTVYAIANTSHSVSVSAAGVGGGIGGSGGNINISGGVVLATSNGAGAAIGGGGGLSVAAGGGGNITISGGYVDAISALGAAIGGGFNASNGGNA